MPSTVEYLIKEARDYLDRECNVSQYPNLVSELADTLEAVYADSLTGQAMHARWQERAEKLEAAIRSALSVESVLPAIATTPRKILGDAL